MYVSSLCFCQYCSNAREGKCWSDDVKLSFFFTCTIKYIKQTNLGMCTSGVRNNLIKLIGKCYSKFYDN